VLLTTNARCGRVLRPRSSTRRGITSVRPFPFSLFSLTFAHFLRSPAVFQQIDIEEHSAPGQGPQIRAFGVTPVCRRFLRSPLLLLFLERSVLNSVPITDRKLGSPARQGFPPLLLGCRTAWIQQQRLSSPSRAPQRTLLPPSFHCLYADPYALLSPRSVRPFQRYPSHPSRFHRQQALPLGLQGRRRFAVHQTYRRRYEAVPEGA
jgi:hypothetical protein